MVPPRVKFRARRAVLVAPGADEHKARKALDSGADEVILDLEDAVTSANKAAARDLACRLVREADPGCGPAISIRVNALDTPWGQDDLAACAVTSSALTSVVLPKVERPDDLIEAGRNLNGVALQALIETPAGVQSIDDITRATDRLSAVIIGYADLGASLGRSASVPSDRWLAIQDRVLVAARAAGIQTIDGPFLGIGDDEPFRAATQWASELGFDGKWVIHPSQIPTVIRSFSPSDHAVAKAREILEILADAEEREGAGAAQLDGQMLDEAVAVAARRTIAQRDGD